jgi:hypothetical protein
MSLALSGSDTIILNNYIFTQLADGNAVEVEFPNAVATVKTGKNGNTIYGLNESGRQAKVKMRVLRGGADDQYLLGLFSLQQANFAATVLNQGQFVKKMGDGAGNITSDTYVLGGGVIEKEPAAKMNVEGEAEQSVTIWELAFSSAVRVIA